MPTNKSHNFLSSSKSTTGWFIRNKNEFIRLSIDWNGSVCFWFYTTVWKRRAKPHWSSQQQREKTTTTISSFQLAQKQEADKNLVMLWKCARQVIRDVGVVANDRSISVVVRTTNGYFRARMWERTQVENGQCYYSLNVKRTKVDFDPSISSRSSKTSTTC